MIFQQIRSATAIITMANVRFLVDPWLGDKGSIPPLPGSPNPDLSCPVHDLPCEIGELLKVDAVIATHLHFDHFDEKAFQVIPVDKTVFVQDETDAGILQNRGFRDVRVLSSEGVDFMGIKLFKTECLHGQKNNIDALYKMVNLRKEACGVVFQHPDEKTFYLAGDTIFYEGVIKAIESFSPQIIAVNAAEASIAGFGNIIMGIKDIENTLEAAPEATLIATHMDEVGHSRLWRRDLRVFIKQNMQEHRLVVPENGESMIY